MTRLLIIADDEIGPVMAGPGIRFRMFADLLSTVAEVTVAVPHEVNWQPEDWRLVPYSRYGTELEQLIEDTEIILCKSFSQFFFPQIVRDDRILICDLYDPFMFENLEASAGHAGDDGAYTYQFNLDLIKDQIRRGDFFICANERQRDLWMGMLSTLGRINHVTYAEDKTMRALIDIVPFGLPTAPPEHEKPVIKGVWPGIAATDRVLLWGGGVWKWLDPETPLRAMALLADEHPDIKFCFMGRKRPAASWYAPAEGFSQLDDAVELLAKELGVLGRNVFFNDHWVPANMRGAYLLEADAGIIAHPLGLETHYSARTRAIDYLWAGLPIITTTGDTVAEWVERYDIGAVVPPHDPEAFARAVLDVLAQPKQAFAERMAPLASSLTWERAVEPLLRFCANPRPAPDRGTEQAQHLQQSLEASVTHRDMVIRDLEAAIRARDVEIEERKGWLATLEAAIQARDIEIDERKAWLATLEEGIQHRDGIIAGLEQELDWRHQSEQALTTALQHTQERVQVLENRFGLIDAGINSSALLARRLLERTRRR
jgi:glycosyltransferase involved in cell wall biosynthesis